MTPTESRPPASAPAPMLDLQAVEAGLRWQTWARAADQFFPGLNVRELTASPAAGWMRGRRFGPGELWSIFSPPLHIEYAPSRGEAAGQCGLALKDSFSLMLQIRGSTLTSQDGRVCCLEGGQICLVDGTIPFDLEVVGAFSQLMFLRMPRQLLLSKQPHLRQRTAAIFDPREAGTKLLSTVLLDVLQATAQLEQEQCTALLLALAQMLGVLKSRPDDTHWRVQGALAFIDAHLSDASLTATRVAQAQQISRRRLDDIMLGAVGTSLTAQIWLRRLLQASDALLDPRQTRRSIGDIAFDCGFTDTAHFTRAFKRHYGCTPRRWRIRNADAHAAS